MIPPSGEQHEISRGSLRAVIVEVGGGLRELTCGDWHVLDGYRDDEMCSAARGHPLIPWPNRLRDGRYTWDGEELQVALSEADWGNAIHGLVRWSRWELAERGPDHLVMSHRLHPQPGYPFLLDLRTEYRLEERGLTAIFHAANAGVRALPLAVGVHPYVQLGEGPIDQDELAIPARTRLQTDDRMIPTGSSPVEGTDFDFRTPRRLGPMRLDTAFADLERGSDGRAVVVQSRGERSVRVWQDEHFTHVMAFTADTLPDPAERRRSLGVEPMTCAPNGLQTGEGVIRLEPGEEWSASWGIQVS